MRATLIVIVLSSLIHASSAKDVAVGDAFTISLPDTAKEQTRSEHSYGFPDTILQKYSDESFQLHVYRWPTIRASMPLEEIPAQWAKDKQWASVSNIGEGTTNSGIPYVTFKVRIDRGERSPFDSEMTVLRSPSGEAFMFQMSGVTQVTDAIRESIQSKPK